MPNLMNYTDDKVNTQNGEAVHALCGLSQDEARQRLRQYGPNRVELRRDVRFIHIFLEEVQEPMILLLLAVTVGYFLLGEILEAVTVLLIVTAILFVEVWTEYRAKASVAALQALAEPFTLVLRDGEVKTVQVEDVVPGDCLVLRAGSRVPADARLVCAYDLATDESALTGESFPVEKKAAPMDVKAPIEHQHQIFRGTLVVRGEGLAVVTATGLSTEIGRIAGMMRAAKPPRTPLQQMMKQLSKMLAIVALSAAVLIPALLILVDGQKWSDALLAGLSLAFATIPEELPILVVMVLGLGSLRLARSKVVIRRMNSAETLGHVTVVITDKTGTLTENRQRLVGAFIPGQKDLMKPSELSHTPAGCRLTQTAYTSLLSQDNEALTLWNEPLERALIEGLPKSISKNGSSLFSDVPIQRIPFSSDRGWSGVLWGQNHRAVKGVPEVILSSCDKVLYISEDKEREEILNDAMRYDILRQVDQLAERGYRLLGVAQDDVFMGLLVFADPLRQEAAQAVSTARKAGIKVIMATGDHPYVARSVAAQIGLPTDQVVTGDDMEQWTDEKLQDELRKTFIFARIKPHHKLRLVRAFQAQKEVVAMIGDGINDGPAIAAADIGIAMGESGTDVARENAGLILADDRFETLAKAIHEGRGMFANLQKAVRYYLAIKVALVISMLIPAILGLTMPFSPIMIILMELFMDLAASTAFVIEPAEKGLMDKPPRKADKPFLDSFMNCSILTGGLMLSASVLFSSWAAGFWTVSGASAAEVIRSSAFAAWMWGHVLLAFIFRYMHMPVYHRPFANRILNVWAISAMATVLLILYVPLLRDIFNVTVLMPLQWALSLGIPLIMAVVLAFTRRLWQGTEG